MEYAACPIRICTKVEAGEHSEGLSIFIEKHSHIPESIYNPLTKRKCCNRRISSPPIHRGFSRSIKKEEEVCSSQISSILFIRHLRQQKICILLECLSPTRKEVTTLAGHQLSGRIVNNISPAEIFHSLGVTRLFGS